MPSPKKAKLADPFEGEEIVVGNDGNTLATPSPAKNKGLQAPGTTGTLYVDAHDGLEGSPQSRGTTSPTTAPRDDAPAPVARTSPTGASAMEIDDVSANAAAESEPQTLVRSDKDSSIEDTANDTIETVPAEHVSSKSSLLSKAAGGCQESLNLVKGDFCRGSISKKEYTNALRSYTDVVLSLRVSAVKNVNGFNHMMQYVRDIDKGGFLEVFEGIVFAFGPGDAGKSSLINSIACPDGDLLVPARHGSCTRRFIIIQLVRCKDTSKTPSVTLHLPGEAPLNNLIVRETRCKIDDFMHTSPSVPGGDSTPIRVTLVSPFVTNMTIVDTPGDPESKPLIESFVAQQKEPISVLYSAAATDLSSAGHGFDILCSIFREAGLPFSPNNVIVVMSKPDELIDNDFQQKLRPEATNRAWRVKMALQFKEEYDKAPQLRSFPIVGIVNPNTATGMMFSESQLGLDLVDGEDQFLRLTGVCDLGLPVGRKALAKLINDNIIGRHIHSWRLDELTKLERELQKRRAALADLGDDPSLPRFGEVAVAAYKNQVLQAVGAMAKKIDIGGDEVEKISPCLSIVKKVVGLENVEITSSKFTDNFTIAIENAAVNAAMSAVREVQGSGNMKLGRFAPTVEKLYETDTRRCVKHQMTKNSFKEKCSQKVAYHKDLVENLSGCIDLSKARKNIEFSLSNLAAICVANLRRDLDCDLIGSLSGVDFTKGDSPVRREYEKYIENANAKIALLRQLPLPPQPRENEDPAADDSINFDMDGDDDEDGDDDLVGGPGRGDAGDGGFKKGGSDVEPSSDEDGDDNDNRGGGKSSSNGSDKGSEAKLSREIASLAYSFCLPPTVVSEQSPSEGETSDTDSEDFVGTCGTTGTTRRTPQRKSARGNGTPRKPSSQSVATSNKRKQKAPGIASKQKSKRAKKGAKMTFSVGTKIESHFMEPEKGWYEGEIVKREGGVNTVMYSFDGKCYEASDEQLSREIRGTKHRLV